MLNDSVDPNLSSYIDKLKDSNFDSYYLNIPNSSHYLNSTSRRSFRVVNPLDFSVMQSKQLSYYVRLYFHYKNVQLLGGWTFFYTLTYNDNALPKYGDVNCVDYEDLRYFLRSSGFDKQLLRNYGYKLQYFIACELGEGKGMRGIENNPHYHCIFFLIPCRKEGEIYQSFDALVFRHLVKTYWQGEDYKRKFYRAYKYGIAKEGENDGVVNSPAALSYVSKYVLKDTPVLSLERRLCSAGFQNLMWKLFNTTIVRERFYKYARSTFPEFHGDDYFVDYFFRDEKMRYFCCCLFNKYYKRKLLNRYAPKVRISQGVGLYALDKVNDDGITLTIPVDSKTVKSVPLPLYIYRKLYYDVVKDAKNNPKYVLNEAGIDLKAATFERSINKRINELSKALQLYNSPIDASITTAMHRYAIYDLVYRDRYCPNLGVSVKPLPDYVNFLRSEFYRTNYLNDLEVFYFHKKHKVTYIFHPYFAPYRKQFDYFDKLLEKMYICASDASYRRFVDIRSTKRHISKAEFKSKLNEL